MSTQTVTSQTNNQIFVDNDYTKFLYGENYFGSGNVVASGADVDLVAGMVLGRIAATGKIVPLAATATDGSQLAVGLAVRTQTVVDGANEDVQFVNKGSVNEDVINFLGAETLDTASGPTSNTRTIRDQLNDLGLVLKAGTELTKVDNS